MKNISIIVKLKRMFLHLFLPLFLGVVVMAVFNIKHLLDNELKQIQENLFYNVSTLENEVKEIQFKAQLWYSENSVDIQLLPSYIDNGDWRQYWMTLRKLQKRMNALQIHSTSIEEVRFYNVPSNVILSTKSGLIAHDSSQIEAIISEYTSQGQQLNVIDGKWNVGYLYPVASYHRTNNTITYIQIILSEDRMIDVLEGSVFSDYTTIYIHQSREKYVANHSFDSNKYKELLQNSDKKWMLYNDALCVLLRVDHSIFDSSAVMIVPVSDLIGNNLMLLLLYLGYIFVALFIIYVYCRIVNQKIQNPVKDILDAIKKIENEKFNQVVPVKHGISEFDTIYDSLVRMKDSLVYLRECVYQKDLYTQQIELKQLQAQVNPHFLYNSFFTVSRMLDNEDYDSAAEMCRYLGEFFSYITRNARMMIPIQEELRHAQFYLKIQKIRFADRLEIFYASEPPWTEKMMIPKLVIQPVLENFMKYVAEKEKGKAILHISFMEKDSCRAVIIEDNGSDMSDEKLAALQMKLLNVSPSEEITGLLNIQRRMKLFCQNQSGLYVSRSLLGGLKVELRFYYKDDTPNNSREVL